MATCSQRPLHTRAVYFGYKLQKKEFILLWLAGLSVALANYHDLQCKNFPLLGESSTGCWNDFSWMPTLIYDWTWAKVSQTKRGGIFIKLLSVAHCSFFLPQAYDNISFKETRPPRPSFATDDIWMRFWIFCELRLEHPNVWVYVQFNSIPLCWFSLTTVWNERGVNCCTLTCVLMRYHLEPLSNAYASHCPVVGEIIKRSLKCKGNLT